MTFPITPDRDPRDRRRVAVPRDNGFAAIIALATCRSRAGRQVTRRRYPCGSSAFARACANTVADLAGEPAAAQQIARGSADPRSSTLHVTQLPDLPAPGRQRGRAGGGSRRWATRFVIAAKRAPALPLKSPRVIATPFDLPRTRWRGARVIPRAFANNGEPAPSRRHRSPWGSRLARRSKLLARALQIRSRPIPSGLPSLLAEGAERRLYAVVRRVTLSSRADSETADSIASSFFEGVPAPRTARFREKLIDLCDNRSTVSCNHGFQPQHSGNPSAGPNHSDELLELYLVTALSGWRIETRSLEFILCLSARPAVPRSIALVERDACHGCSLHGTASAKLVNEARPRHGASRAAEARLLTPGGAAFLMAAIERARHR